jgi:hypothetical protein
MDLYANTILKTRRFDLSRSQGHADEALLMQIKQLAIDKLGFS